MDFDTGMYVPSNVCETMSGSISSVFEFDYIVMHRVGGCLGRSGGWNRCADRYDRYLTETRLKVEIYMSHPPDEDERKRRMGIMSFFTSIFHIPLFDNHRPPSSGASSEGILRLPCIERLNSVYLDCCCAETDIEEVEVFRYQKANNKRRLSFIRDILLGRRNTTLF